MPSPLPTFATAEDLQSLLYGFTKSQVLFTALELGIFECLAENGPQTTEHLARELSLDARALRKLLHALIALRLLSLHPEGHYALPPQLVPWLTQDSPESLVNLAAHWRRLADNWHQLTDVIRTGLPAPASHSLEELENRDASLIQGLYATNLPLARQLAQTLTQHLPEPPKQWLDIGGGSAVWSLCLLNQWPASTLTVMDFAPVLSVTREYVALHECVDRVNYWSADLDAVRFPENDFDGVMLAHVCHHIGQAGTEKLLTQISKTLRPGGKLLLVDFLVPGDSAPTQTSPWARLFDLNLLVSTQAGRVFTWEEMILALEQAGFSEITRIESMAEGEHETTALLATLNKELTYYI
jgi:3-hydroxy-5-methyl-1-naphthoate 3-O-methyltransferase